MAPPPTVSIGLPVYNGERYLGEALDSITHQSFAGCEIIVSDNASSDETWAICQAYAARDPRFRLIRQPANVGAAANFNAVMRIATGRFFKWMAADDVIHPEFVADCLESFQRRPELVLTYPRAVLIDDMGALIGPVNRHGLSLESPNAVDRVRSLLHSYTLDAQVAMELVMGMFRTDQLRRLEPLGNYYGADMVLALEAAIAGPAVGLTATRASFRRHHASSSYRPVPRAAEQQRFYDPRIRGRLAAEIRLRRRYFDMARVAGGSRLPARDRLAMLGMVAAHVVRRGQGKVRSLTAKALPAPHDAPSA